MESPRELCPQISECPLGGNGRGEPWWGRAGTRAVGTPSCPLPSYWFLALVKPIQRPRGGLGEASPSSGPWIQGKGWVWRCRGGPDSPCL